MTTPRPKKTNCKWYEVHNYSRWEDTHTGSNGFNQPVIVQEKRCVICNKVSIRMSKPTK